jgi:hypothetical protein
MPIPQDHSNRHLTPENKVKIKLTVLIFQHTTYNIHPLVTKIHISDKITRIKTIGRGRRTSQNLCIITDQQTTQPEQQHQTRNTYMHPPQHNL